MAIRRELAALLLVGLALAASGTQPLSGQNQTAQPGARIRLKPVGAVFDTSLLRGTLVARRGDTLDIRTAADGRLRTTILRDNVQLEFSIGREPALVQGAGVGLIVGGTVGVLAGVASYQSPGCQPNQLCFDFGPGMSALAGGLIGAGAGAVLGLLIGSQFHTEQWVAERRPARVTFTVAPRGGVALGLRAAF